MKKNNRRSELLRLIAVRALANVDQLQPASRARVYDGVALILPKSDPLRDSAQRLAFHLREAEEQQHRFTALLAEQPTN